MCAPAQHIDVLSEKALGYFSERLAISFSAIGNAKIGNPPTKHLSSGHLRPAARHGTDLLLRPFGMTLYLARSDAILRR
jgi:hypothetical protein